MSNKLTIAAGLRHSHGKKILEHDLARIRKLVAGHSPHGPNVRHDKTLLELFGHKHRPVSAGTGQDTSISVTDANVTYTMQVGVGSSAKPYKLLIDTGSSNTWIGADQDYVKTNTSKSTGKKFSVSYGSGTCSGTEYIDKLTLSAGLVIDEQSIGVASSAQGFDGVDGILGIGPVELTQGTVNGETTVPTVTDNLKTNGTISNESIGISFAPTTGSDTSSALNGELTFGANDTSKYTGKITYAPITKKSPASSYWGIDQSITYGDGTPILDLKAGIVDTGTTLVYLASDAFARYQKATGAELDEATGLLKLSKAGFANLKSMFFHINGESFEWTADAQIWPVLLNADLGGDEDSIYLTVADSGTNSGTGLDFINGFTFLQRVYTEYDTTGSRVGFAETKFTYEKTNQN